MVLIPIREIQGEGYYSPYAGQIVRVEGVVTAVLRRGFFLQTPEKLWDGKGSNAVFVYSSDWVAPLGSELEVVGECVDFIKHNTAKPVTQVKFGQARIKNSQGPRIKSIALKRDMLSLENDQLAPLLNSLEAMLVSVAAGQTFIAPSNRYGDYVLALDSDGLDTTMLRNKYGGVIMSSANPLRWFPGFRVINYNHALRLNVGAKLKSPVEGPLNYRVDAYQIAVSSPFEIEESFINLTRSSLVPEPGAVTIMTLNCFNLDPYVESEVNVMNPNQDVDDDWGEGRFHTLAQAVVLQANIPDIVALQEIQDNDGAEISEVVDASKAYSLLIGAIKQLSGVRYEWVDVAPKVGADGGQPGGNIRNGFLYNPERISLNKSSVKVLGRTAACFEGSRKPLVCEFTEKGSGASITVINVHLASKRHQESVFALDNPGVDTKLDIRTAQAELIKDQAEACLAKGMEFYITGDFNDTEYSEPLMAIVGKIAGEKSVNLVLSLPEEERYDYNHRGKLQVLMHGIVSKRMAGQAQYEVIHGNELIGVTPGEDSNKPSDHAYVIAKLVL